MATDKTLTNLTFELISTINSSANSLAPGPTILTNVSTASTSSKQAIKTEVPPTVATINNSNDSTVIFNTLPKQSNLDQTKNDVEFIKKFLSTEKYQIDTTDSQATTAFQIISISIFYLVILGMGIWASKKAQKSNTANCRYTGRIYTGWSIYRTMVSKGISLTKKLRKKKL